MVNATYFSFEMMPTAIPCHRQQWQKWFYHMSLDCHLKVQAVQVLYDFRTTHCSVSDTEKATHITPNSLQNFLYKRHLLIL